MAHKELRSSYQHPRALLPAPSPPAQCLPHPLHVQGSVHICTCCLGSRPRMCGRTTTDKHSTGRVICMLLLSTSAFHLFGGCSIPWTTHDYPTLVPYTSLSSQNTFSSRTVVITQSIVNMLLYPSSESVVNRTNLRLFPCTKCVQI